MPYQKLVAACLAFLLAFYCYPVSCGSAFADETLLVQSFEDGDLVAGGLESGFGIDAAGVEPSGGSPVLPPVADVGDSIGSDIGSDSDSFDSADEIVSFSGGVTAYAAAPIVSELGKKILAALGGAAINSLANNLVSTLGGSKPSVSETLLAAILGWQSILSDDNGTINTRLLNLYNLVNQMYTNDFKGIYSLISHIGVNTDLFKTHLSNVASRLLWFGNLGSGSTNYTAAELLGNLNLLAQQQRNSLASIAGRMIYEGDIGYGSATYTLSELAAQLARTTRSASYRTGVLSGISSSSLIYSTADLLFHLNNLLYRRTVYDGDIGYGSTTYTVSELVASLARTTRIVNYRTGVLSWVSSSERTYSTADLLFYLNGIFNSRTLYTGDIGFGTGSYTMSELLGYVVRNVRGTGYHTGVLSGVSSSSLTYGTADILFHTYNLLREYLPKLAAPLVSFDDSRVVSYLSRILTALSEDGAIAVAVSVDTSALQALREGELKAIYEQLLAMGSFAGDGVLAKLDEITDLLLIAGAKDLVETIVGDFSQITAAVQSSALDSVLQSAFPFCIPAVLKQLLGLLEYEAAAPVFDFEIGGQPMHVDASAAQGFADLVSWACRFLFLFGLLVSTRKFIYTGVAQ